MYQNIFLHIPHHSAYIPKQLGDHSSPALRNLRANAFYLIDYHTLPLFNPANPNLLVHTLCARDNRMLVDMERLPDDPLESNGFGIVSQWAIDWLGEEFRQVALEQYNAYHAYAAKCLNALKNTMLIDCHSFSSLPTQLCPTPQDVDICIGWNEDETTPERMLLGLVAAYFMDCGYSIGINKPFSNSKTFPGATGYHSLMIEINKRCYMNEETLEKSDNFNLLHSQLQKLYSIILDYK
jgi:N-formylglutamate amidohydrolase